MIKIAAKVQENCVKGKSPEEFEGGSFGGIKLIVNERGASYEEYVLDYSFGFFESFFGEMEEFIGGENFYLGALDYNGALCLELKKDKVRVISAGDISWMELKNGLAEKLKNKTGYFHYSRTEDKFMRGKKGNAPLPTAEIIEVPKVEFIEAVLAGAGELANEIYKLNPSLRQSKYMKEFEEKIAQAKALWEKTKSSKH